MRPISISTRARIEELVQQGQSCRQIALKTGRSKSAVGRIKGTIPLTRNNNKGGRPRKLDVRSRRQLARSINTAQVESAAEAAEKLANEEDLRVSPQTIRNALRAEGLVSVTKKKRPYLSTTHRKARLSFANKYRHWTVADWQRVIWSDESKINLFGSDGRRWTWKKKGSSLADNHVIPTKKFGVGNLMVWDCMTWQGVGMLVEVEGRMDAEQYVNILSNGLIGTLEKFGWSADAVIFQQDGDSKHTANLAHAWLATHQFGCLDWPAQSPDLNPIEHLWGLLKRKVYDFEQPASGVFELWDRVVAAWNNITQEQCRALIDSLPRRLEAVVKARGGHTKY
jgi:transposase